MLYGCTWVIRDTGGGVVRESRTQFRPVAAAESEARTRTVAPERGWSRRTVRASLRYRSGGTLALSIFVVLAAALTANAQIPTAADFAACNDEAPQAVKAGTVSPTTSDRVRAERARAAAVTTRSGDGAASPIQSSDPQIHGMSADGAKDADYQAAYRSCMRRRGF